MPTRIDDLDSLNSHVSGPHLSPLTHLIQYLSIPKHPFDRHFLQLNLASEDINDSKAYKTHFNAFKVSECITLSAHKL